MIKNERSSFSWYNSSLSFLFCRERLESVVSPNYSLRSLSFHGGGGGGREGGEGGGLLLATPNSFRNIANSLNY